MIRRKLEEWGSALYRSLLYPFVRTGIECRTKSIMKQKSYMNRGSRLMGRNYIGKNVFLSNTEVGFGSYINNNGILKNTVIGKYTSIGTDFSCILGKHPANTFVAMHPAFYSTGTEIGFTYVNEQLFCEAVFLDREKEIQIRIGNDVWIGNRVSVMEGVTIGDGAIIAAGAVVTKDVEPYGIYGGVPARKIGSRFCAEEAQELLKWKWWEKEESFLAAHAMDFRNMESFRAMMEKEELQSGGTL